MKSEIRINISALRILKLLLELSLKNNKRLGFTDFRGYSVKDLLPYGEFSATKLKNMLDMLVGADLIYIKKVGMEYFYFPAVDKRIFHEDIIDFILKNHGYDEYISPIEFMKDIEIERND